MSVTLLFRRIVGKYLLTDIMEKKTPEEAKRYLASVPEPENDLQRAIAQENATMYQRRWWKRLLLNTGAAVTYLPYLLKLRRTRLARTDTACDAVFFTDRISIETIPDSVRAEFPRIECVRMAQYMSLTAEDCRFLRELRRKTPFRFYFNLKNMLKIAMISGVLQIYDPKAIIAYWEASPTTSVATMYCQAHGVEHIGIMHGDRDFSLQLTFFRYSRYYVWDTDYRDLLLSLRCEPTQFHVELPEAVRLPGYDAGCEKQYDYTFYLNGESEASLRRASRVCKLLNEQGARIAVRPHPSETGFSYETFFPSADIHWGSEMSLDQSLSITRYAIGKYSTVLYQAMLVGVPVVIDDYSIPGMYENLQENYFVPLKRPHQRVTELLPQLKEEGDKTI